MINGIFLLLQYNAPATQERQVDAWSDKASLRATPQTSLGADYPVSMKRDSLFLDRENQMESHITSSRLSLYGHEHGLGNRSSIIGRSGGPVVTQVCAFRTSTCSLAAYVFYLLKNVDSSR